MHSNKCLPDEGCVKHHNPPLIWKTHVQKMHDSFHFEIAHSLIRWNYIDIDTFLFQLCLLCAFRKFIFSNKKRKTC